jgi:PTS system nitrogen regulatory IIA component
MNLLDHMPDAGFIPGLVCQEKADVIARLVQALTDAGVLSDPEPLLSEIMQREQQGQTAIGGGLCVPHARTPQVNRLQIAVATLERPLAIPAADDQPVDVFVLIIGPASDPRPMLRALARLARLVKDGSLLAALRRASSADAMRAAIAAAEAP